MDLKLFFDPISSDVAVHKSASTNIGQSIYINKERMPEHEGMDVAIIGLQEWRGGDEKHKDGIKASADAIRKEFYALKKGAGIIKVVDLGNFRNGPELEDTYLRLKEVCAYLMENDIFPLLIGGTHDLDLGQYFAYETTDKLITLLNVDNKMDLHDPQSAIAASSHIHRIIKHDPNYLFNYYQLGYQSYLVGSLEADLIEKLSFEAFRLGAIRENVKEFEPIIRDADLISFDMAALQAHYAPGGIDAKVYGLSGEEACQLCWYAGLNNKLTSLGIYGYDAAADSEDRKTAFVISTMLWYFIEGFYNRRVHTNFQSNDYVVYEVPMGEDPASIRFYKSKSTDKWWMEVPHPEEQDSMMRSRIVPCSYTDYETALDGEVPMRWVNTYNKFT